MRWTPTGGFKVSTMLVSTCTQRACLAAHLGLEPRQVMAIGDAESDIPLFDWAGHSVAMPHGWPAAMGHATRVESMALPEEALTHAMDGLPVGMTRRCMSASAR